MRAGGVLSGTYPPESPYFDVEPPLDVVVAGVDEASFEDESFEVSLDPSFDPSFDPSLEPSFDPSFDEDAPSPPGDLRA